MLVTKNQPSILAVRGLYCALLPMYGTARDNMGMPGTLVSLGGHVCCVGRQGWGLSYETAR